MYVCNNMQMNALTIVISFQIFKQKFFSWHPNKMTSSIPDKAKVVDKLHFAQWVKIFLSHLVISGNRKFMRKLTGFSEEGSSNKNG